MNKTTITNHPNKILVNLEELQAMLSIGRNTAQQIAEDAGAVTRFGKRKLYNVEKIREYVDAMREGQ